MESAKILRIKDAPINGLELAWIADEDDGFS